MTLTRRVVLLLALSLPFLAVLAHAEAASSQPVISIEYGQIAIEALGPDLPAVARAHGVSTEKLISRLNLDERLGVDSNRRLFYSEATLAELAADFSAAEGVSTYPVGGVAPLQDTFLLHSRPGSQRVIYLDFDGHVLSGTAWNSLYNSGLDIVCPPWDFDGGDSVFTDAERTRIQQIWQRVAEDYAPFDVDVTTEHPGEDAITRSGESDAHYGMRVLISPISSYFGPYGGMAYVEVFDAVGDFYRPALVFPERLANGEKYIGEACSHECGHTLGLFHDGLVEALGGDEYYTGHGTGETGWAPIMGNGYYKNLTQWSKGEYAGANNTEDDVAIIASNGLSFLADDHGNSPTEATPLPESDIPSLTGYIGGTGDTDLFCFAAGTGQVDVQISLVSPGPNLDVLVELRDESGALLASSNPVDQLPATLSAPVSAGTHHLTVTGSGRGSPLTGYSNYGSLGSYTLTASLPPALATFTITPTAGLGGGIAPSLPQIVNEGESIGFTMVPDPNYHVADVLVDGASVGAVTSYDFTNVSNDHTIDASFVENRPPTLTFTAPTGLGTYTSAQSIPVNWTADQDVSAGEFGVWARSAAGTWYIGQLVPTDGTNAYSTDLALTGVPAGWYQVIVGYRPTLGSGTWLSFATSYGFAFSVDAPPTPALTMTAPVGEASHQAGDTFTATWTASPSLTTGQFAVWVRSADGTGWYWMGPLIPSTGAASYSATVDLTGVAPGLGYQVIVAYEPIANTSLWASWATSPGVFSVGSTAPTITVTQPSGTGNYTSSQSVTADWTTNQNLTGGEFGVWVRSGAGGWYATTLVPATGSSGTLYSTALPLSTVPAGPGNEVIVAYRPVAGTGAFMSWAGSPGSFTVTP